MLKHILLFGAVATSIAAYIIHSEPHPTEQVMATNQTSADGALEVSDFAMLAEGATPPSKTNVITSTLENEQLNSTAELISKLRTTGGQDIVAQLLSGFSQESEQGKRKIIHLLTEAATYETTSGLLSLAQIESTIIIQDINAGIEQTAKVHWDATYTEKLSTVFAEALNQQGFQPETVISIQNAVVSVGSSSGIELMINNINNPDSLHYAEYDYTDNVISAMQNLQSPESAPTLKRLLQHNANSNPDIFVAAGTGLAAMKGHQGSKALLDWSSSSTEETADQVEIWMRKIIRQNESARAFLVKALPNQKFDSPQLADRLSMLINR
ncbi:MAG: hypothetical protein HOM11_11840 [Methylococcales bacterium]|jgi:hypothetical protein|nr:hypothetical protein [Methylococcales bacterium]MBT7445517.1 hypothetical protein [Methylococcales bacterium]